MTAGARWAAGAAVAASLAVHGAVLARVSAPDGGGGAPARGGEVAMIGQSFEDRVAGILRPVADMVPTAAPAVPVTPASDRTTIPRTGPTAPQPPAQDAALSEPAIPTTRAAPVASAVTTRAAAPDSAVAAREAPEVMTPDADTMRPLSRPDRTARPAPSAEAAPTTPASPPAGNAEADARAGSTQGTEAGSAPERQGTPSPAGEATPQQIARYPQAVNRHLGRLRRPSSDFRGTAVIGFTISQGGGLSAIGVVQSSGNAAFDDLALRHIRNAAPFPVPPPGAETRFAVSVRGR